jgi:catechol 2,3-dioxygenase-like lactoylglutathione lyase family enzyme
MTSVKLPVRQIAYFVSDVREAAILHHKSFGSGPFFVADDIPLKSAVHRGVHRNLVHSSAYGQWGGVMIEFVQQNNPGPSAFHDMYPEGSGRKGLHHIALFVDSVADALDRFVAEGFQIALDARMNNDFRFAFVDTIARDGHMLELYEPAEVLTAFYDLVASSAGDFSRGLIIDQSLG